MKAYTVKPGHRFLLPDTGEGAQVVEGGGTVYLDDAEAERFADRVVAKRSKATKPAAEVSKPTGKTADKGD